MDLDSDLFDVFLAHFPTSKFEKSSLWWRTWQPSSMIIPPQLNMESIVNF